LDDDFDAFEGFTRQDRSSHRGLVGRDESAFQALDPKRAAKPLPPIHEPRRPAPKLDCPSARPKDLALGVARVDADGQRVEDCLVQLKKGFEERGLDRNLTCKTDIALSTKEHHEAYQRSRPQAKQERSGAVIVRTPIGMKVEMLDYFGTAEDVRTQAYDAVEPNFRAKKTLAQRVPSEVNKGGYLARHRSHEFTGAEMGRGPPDSLCVLVVEDESLIAMLIEDALAELNCTVVAVASSLRDALDKASSMDFDVAIFDVNLNGSPSYPIAELLVRRGIPFIFSTGVWPHWRARGIPRGSRPGKAVR
jgi:hypothetical protein